MATANYWFIVKVLLLFHKEAVILKNNLVNLLFLFLFIFIATTAACNGIVTHKLVLLFTGDTLGIIEPCG
jgi:hypothetical protein